MGDRRNTLKWKPSKLRKTLKQWAKKLSKESGMPVELAEWIIMAALMDEVGHKIKTPPAVEDIVSEIIRRINGQATV